MSGVGTWDAPYENALGIVGAHAVVLYTGKVLYWSFDQRALGLLNTNPSAFYNYFADPNLGSYQLWDPASPHAVGQIQEIGRNAFCAGQCALPDGSIFVGGGQDLYGAVEILMNAGNAADWLSGIAKWFFDAVILGDENGGALKDIHTYDVVDDVWIQWPEMPDGRYYPTCLELGDGSAFIAGGLSNLQRWVFSGSNWCENDQYQIYPPGQLAFAPQPSKFWSADQYPIIRLLPGSRRLFVHIETTTRIFDLDTGSFIDGAVFMPPNVGMQTYPMQTGHVLLPQKDGDPPRILVVGGSTASGFDYDTQSTAPAVPYAFIFDYNASAPEKSAWRKTGGDLHDPRLLSDTVLLPDGTVFVVNGITLGAAAGHSGPVVGTAEIFDPVTETFTRAASPSAKHPRGYHATAVLLPDARVAIAGNTAAYNPGEVDSVDDVSIEIYNPPYLKAGPRPVVATPIPASVGYGAIITILNDPSAPISAVMLMRGCAVTHSNDMDQRAVQLAVTPGHTAHALDINLPSDRSLAPPGPYMLFFLADGVPSVASVVFLGVPAPTGSEYPPPGCEAGGPYPAVSQGTLNGPGHATDTYDGDVTIDRIDNGFDLVLRSDHGGIMINTKIDNGSFASLTACGAVEIGQKIDQGSHAVIMTQGDVIIGQKVDQHSGATIISGSGSLTIGEKVDQHSTVQVKVGGNVSIGQKVDQHSQANVEAQGDVVIDQGIDQHATADITSVSGSIIIGEAVDGNANAILSAPNGSITIKQKVAGGATVKWHAKSFTCPDTSGGTVTEF
jgi:hypothetical protein